MQLAWKAGHDGDPARWTELFGPYRAVIRPDARHGGWAWAVYHFRNVDDPVVTGLAYDERDARHAVAEWARPRAPRFLRRRLRSSGHLR
ncbi:MAG: hypothetical protein AMXMBFR46_14410 [Acidimicrobiia bacterium]